MTTKPYEYPHPNPWTGYGYLEAEIRYRFQCFEKEAWFKQSVIAYGRAQDNDDEWGADEIIKSLEETAAQRGITILHRECNLCEEPKQTVGPEEPTCIECLAEEEKDKYDREQEKKRREEEWARLSPEERERIDKENREFMAAMRNGLIARDVQ